jgi:DNA repair protein RecO (recombination protein O)
MPSYRDDAIVLRTHLLGEADRIVTMLGRKRGKIRAVAKGVRKTTSRFGARLEPFSVVDVQVYEGKTLDIVQTADTIQSYSREITEDYPRYTAAMVMVETADRLTEHDYQPAHYSLLHAGLRSLSEGEHEPGLSVDSYLLRALAIAGWEPSLQDCAVTGAPGDHRSFSVALGGVVASEVAPPGTPTLGLGTKELLAALLEGDWKSAEAAGRSAQVEASGVIAAYTQYHLERHVRSLGHLDRSGAVAAS